MKLLRIILILALGFITECDLLALMTDSKGSFLVTRENDPDIFVKNVNVIQGNYAETEIDTVVSGPDPLVVSRHYNSLWNGQETNLGGWSLFSYCYLVFQKNPKLEGYTTPDGQYEHWLLFTDTDKGDTLCYGAWVNITDTAQPIYFEIEEDLCSGLANTARNEINAWTNQKNNKINYQTKTQTIEVVLARGGKRLYVKINENQYLLQQEILPSGNKIFYQYDQGRVVSIELKNNSEKKVLSWIKVSYGDEITITTSDLNTISYKFSKVGEHHALSTVNRSHKPSISYSYDVIQNRVLLHRKDLPEHRYTQIDYDKGTKKVRSYTEPLDSSRLIVFNFDYKENGPEGGSTTVQGPNSRIQIYHYNTQNQLVQIDDYLEGSLYRVHKKRWGAEDDRWNIASIAIEDYQGDVFYYKSFEYNENGNILEEREYGNLTGANSNPIKFSDEDIPTEKQDVHVKKYTYTQDEKYDIIKQIDIKKNVLECWYRKGADILLAKITIQKQDRTTGFNDRCRKREFFHYNDEGVLIRATVDDGSVENSPAFYSATEIHITDFTPRANAPNYGAPAIIEEKYVGENKNSEILLKKVINHFDAEGNVNVQEIIDSEGKHQYSLRTDYENGLLISETDPEGRTTTYSYDESHNLLLKTDHTSGVSYAYDYDLSNHRIRTIQKGCKGASFERSADYDEYGHLIREVDSNGHETIYQYDDLGRLKVVTYPKIETKRGTLTNPVYTYSYDLFDNPISIQDPEGKVTSKLYTVRHQPTWIQYPDGSEEFFKYDTEGTLHRHRSRDGTTSVFEYDFLGRLMHKQRYPRGDSPNESESTNEYWQYNTFHLDHETNVKGKRTFYTYDRAGRTISKSFVKEKEDYQYDSLGRISSIKRWKTDKTFTLETRKYNLSNQILEESVENHQGKILLKTKRVYTPAGQLQDIIGYPNNQESILSHYEYDEVGRIREITDGSASEAKFGYDDHYLNEYGQKVLKVTTQDPSGTKTEEIFDPFGRVASLSKIDESGKILYQKNIGYDLLGHKVSEDYLRDPSNTLPNNYVIRWKYEKGDQWTSLIQAEGSPEEYAEKRTYNIYGDLKSRLPSANQKPITYEYSPLGFLKSMAFHQEARGEETEYSFWLDQKGYITRARYPYVAFTSYNRNDNDLLEDDVFNGKTWGGPEYSVTCSYDGEGLITSLTLPDKSIIEYSYDGPLVSQITRTSKDKTELYKHRIVSYDLMGNVLEEILPFNGGLRKHFWDQQGREVGIKTDFFQDKVPDGGYDALSRLESREISFGKSTIRFSYGYDDLSQLTSEQAEDKHTYTYDSLENRLAYGEKTYKINGFNQLIEDSRSIYTYDNGNLAKKGTSTFQFDPLGRLSTLKDPKGNIITYSYDAFGRRLVKKFETKDKSVKTYRYFYFGEIELGCLDETGAIIELKIPLNPNQGKSAACIAFELKKGAYVPLYDLQGNVACLINPKQRKIVERYEYTAFGVERIFNESGKIVTYSPAGNPWRYLGKRTDSESGLVYFGKRYYDPPIGRWISPDPLGPQDGPNLYAFAHNNPFYYTDAFGLEAEKNVKNNEKFLSYFHGEYEPHCACEHHRECRKGGKIGSAVGGATLGGIRYGFSTLRSFVSQYGTLAMEDFLEEFPFSQREEIRAGVEEAWEEMEQTAKDRFIEAFGIDSTYETTLAFEKGANFALIAADYFRPGFKNPKQLFHSLNRSKDIAKTKILFGQKTVSSKFAYGEFKGRSIAEISKALREGIISPDKLPIDFIEKNGVKIALNNRSLLALRRAGLEPTKLIDRTGDPFFERLLRVHLKGASPSTELQIRGGLPGTSLISP